MGSTGFWASAPAGNGYSNRLSLRLYDHLQ